MIRRAGEFGVLDVETAPSDEVIRLLGRSSGAAPGDRVAVHELTAASLLTFRRTDEGAIREMRLRSVSADAGGERGALCALAPMLGELWTAGGCAITYNGVHDFSVLGRRAARHWLFEALPTDEWTVPGTGRHVDVMRDGAGCLAGGRWASLVDACAALGVTAVLDDPGPRTAPLPVSVRKSQVDVVATFVLWCYALSAAERTHAAVLEGWAALGRYLARPGVRGPHLDQFLHHPLARAVERAEVARARRNAAQAARAMSCPVPGRSAGAPRPRA